MSSISCGVMPKRAALVAVDRRASACVPPVCWSVATSRSCGSVCSFARSFGAQSFELGDVGVLQRVLELRAGDAAADVDVLRRLQEQRARPRPWRACGRRRAMICMRRCLALVARLQRDEQAPVVASALPMPPIVHADAGDVRDRLRRSRAERAPAAAPSRRTRCPARLRTMPMIRPVSCCGKKPFGNDRRTDRPSAPAWRRTPQRDRAGAAARRRALRSIGVEHARRSRARSHR